MNKRIFCMLMAALTMLLCGCQLAQPDDASNGVSGAKDELVGVFVTTEHLDLFDIDAWLEDNLDSALSGETSEIVGGSEYQGRIYAERVEKTITNASGESSLDVTYTFGELEGFLLAAWRIYDPAYPGDTNYAYLSVNVGEGMCDVYNSVKAVDGESVRGLTATMFLSKDVGEVIFYLNPVYQSADGSVYLVAGSGLQFSADLGARAAQSVSDSVTVTENGVTTKSSCKIEVGFEVVEVARKVVLVEMDENNVEIGRTECIPGEMPETFTPSAEAAYLIVEEYRDGGVFRSICQYGEEKIEVFALADGWVCDEEIVTVNW